MIRPVDSPPSAVVIPLQPEPSAPVIETKAILARYTRGRCGSCRGAIRADELIQLVDRRWTHEECVPANAVPSPALEDQAA